MLSGPWQHLESCQRMAQRLRALRAIQQAAGIGLEPTLGEWVQNIVAVMREVRRVLRDDGTCWLNLGDAYTSEQGGSFTRHATEKGQWRPNGPKHGIKMPWNRRQNEGRTWAAQELMGQPWRVAFALQDDGWLLRSAIVWHKPNPMPESVRDRPTNAYEMIFLLSEAGASISTMQEAIREGEQRRDRSTAFQVRRAND